MMDYLIKFTFCNRNPGSAGLCPWTNEVQMDPMDPQWSLRRCNNRYILNSTYTQYRHTFCVYVISCYSISTQTPISHFPLELYLRFEAGLPPGACQPRTGARQKLREEVSNIPFAWALDLYNMRSSSVVGVQAYCCMVCTTCTICATALHWYSC